MVPYLIRSLVILCIISAVIGAALHIWIGFWSGFAIGFAVQIIGWLLWDTLAIQKVRRAAAEAEARAIQAAANQEIPIVCPCTRNVELTCPIRLDRENIVDCEACGNKIGIQVDLSTFLKTTPLNVEMSKLSLEKQFDLAVQEHGGTSTINGQLARESIEGGDQ